MLHSLAQKMQEPIYKSFGFLFTGKLQIRQYFMEYAKLFDRDGLTKVSAERFARVLVDTDVKNANRLVRLEQ